MTDFLARRAGNALTWKAIQLAGTKGTFFVRTLILATILSPDDFGLFAIPIIALGFLTITTELGMMPALVQLPEASEAHYNGAWTAGVVRALGISAVLFVGAPIIAVIFAEPRAVAILRVLALKPLIDAIASIRIVELSRDLKYRRLAFVSLSAVAVDTAVSLTLAMALGVWALVVGALFGSATGVVFSYIAAPHRPRLVFERHAIRPLIRYGRWVFLTGLVSVAASSVTQVVISRQLGAFELGLYFLATKVAFLPYELASQVVGEVAFPLYARIQRDRLRVERAFRSILVGMVMFLLPLYVLLISLAPWFVPDVLGERWKGTEPLIQLLALVGAVGLFSDACRPLFRGLGHPKWVLALEFAQSSLVIAPLWSVTRQYGAVGATLAWLIAVAVSQLLHFLVARRLVERPLAGVWLPLAFVLMASIAGAATAIIVTRFVAGLAGSLIAVVLAPSVTATLIWLCDRRYNLGLRTVLTQTFPQVAGLIGFAAGRWPTWI